MVVVEDVLEVDVAFVAFVFGDGQGGRWVVDCVDGVLPAGTVNILGYAFFFFLFSLVLVEGGEYS